VKVIILRGVPGSGKSTESKKYSDAYIVSADHYFIGADGIYRFDMGRIASAHGQCKAKFAAALKAKKPTVIVDNTNTTVKEFKYYVELAKAEGYEVEIIRIDCDPSVAAARNVHGVPKEAVLRMAERLSTSKIPSN